jgi:LmbE family N-acetylglucosaminyl deacetylase
MTSRFTVVSFHAHPDDEAIYTAGTLARVAAEGHRVVLVVATNGELGLASSSYGGAADLGARRVSELEESARLLGVDRVERLGYRDSGSDGRGAPGSFATLDVDVVAEVLAGILRSERADLVTVYDKRGGYGHPDHVQVHRVGVRAAELAGTPVVMEATVDRDVFRWVIPAVQIAQRLLRGWHVPPLGNIYTARSAITHRIDVGAYADCKRAAMAAHASQATADGASRTLALLLRLPRPVFRRVFRYEWFIERGRAPGAPLCDDLFETLRRQR